MTSEQFLEAVQQRAALDSTDDAREATEAVLRPLSARLTDGEAADLAERLPDSVDEPLVGPETGEAEPLSLDEFLDRVSDREGVGVETAREHSRAVFAALAETVGTGELEEARFQLPSEFDVLFERPEE